MTLPDFAKRSRVGHLSSCLGIIPSVSDAIAGHANSGRRVFRAMGSHGNGLIEATRPSPAKALCQAVKSEEVG